MCRTPAPPSTPLVAAVIWSGTGEVNTSPAQAASSMPGPTNPACIGSCPDPPPETSPTLPRTGASPPDTTRWSCSALSSGWAAAMPRSASATTSSGALMSFFISAPDVAVTSDEGARWQEARRTQPAHTSSARTDGLWARDVGPSDVWEVRVSEVDCCIAGGGPAGMMLGLLLARQGVEGMDVEKHGDFLRDFRGDTVHPSTLRLLDELGLADEFLELPHQKVTQVGLTT